MSTTPSHDPDQAILRHSWETMPESMQRTVTSAPMIPQIAARAKAAAAAHPEFIRGDQGQVVDVMPGREVYYGPSSGLPELRRLVGRFWTLAYGLEGCSGFPEQGLGEEHTAINMGRFSAIPGSGFGAPGCIRFGYAGIPLDGIERLGEALPEVFDALQ